MKSKHLALVAIRNSCEKTIFFTEFKAAVPHATYVDFYCENEDYKLDFDIFKETINTLESRVASGSSLFIPLVDAAQAPESAQLQVTAFLLTLDRLGYDLLVFARDTEEFIKVYDYLIPSHLLKNVVGVNNFTTQYEFNSYMRKFEQDALAKDPLFKQGAFNKKPNSNAPTMLAAKSIYSKQRNFPFASQSNNDLADVAIFLMFCAMMWFSLRCNTRSKNKFKRQ